MVFASSLGRIADLVPIYMVISFELHLSRNLTNFASSKTLVKYLQFDPLFCSMEAAFHNSEINPKYSDDESLCVSSWYVSSDSLRAEE